MQGTCWRGPAHAPLALRQSPPCHGQMEYPRNAEANTFSLLHQPHKGVDNQPVTSSILGDENAYSNHLETQHALEFPYLVGLSSKTLQDLQPICLKLLQTQYPHQHQHRHMEQHVQDQLPLSPQ